MSLVARPGSSTHAAAQQRMLMWRHCGTAARLHCTLPACPAAGRDAPRIGMQELMLHMVDELLVSCDVTGLDRQVGPGQRDQRKWAWAEEG